MVFSFTSKARAKIFHPTIILNNLEISPYQIESVIHNYSRYVETDSFIQDFGLNQAHAEHLCTIIKLSVSL